MGEYQLLKLNVNSTVKPVCGCSRKPNGPVIWRKPIQNSLGFLSKASHKKNFSATHQNPPLRNNIFGREALIKLSKEFCIGLRQPIALPRTTINMFYNVVTSKPLDRGVQNKIIKKKSKNMYYKFKANTLFSFHLITFFKM